jgi:hypothetical protein
VLDRQAVAIPARHERHIEPRHQLRADDQVLEHLVQQVAEVDVAVGIGRAVVEDEPLVAACRVASRMRWYRPPSPSASIDGLLELRLALDEVGLHRERRLGQGD